jgi:hypothetical protein
MAGIFSVFVPQVTRTGAKGMCIALSKGLVSVKSSSKFFHKCAEIRSLNLPIRADIVTFDAPGDAAILIAMIACA